MSTTPGSLVERWTVWYERRQQEVAESVAAQLVPARRLAYLLYGNWPAADRAVRTAVGRYAVSGNPRRWNDRTPPVLRDAIILQYLSASGPWGLPLRIWTLLAGWGRLGRVRGLGLLRLGRAVGRPDRVPARVVTGREVLGQALGEVSPRQRAVLVCRHYERLDVAATARLLGCSEEAVNAEAAAGARALAEAVVHRRDAAEGAAAGPVVSGAVVVDSLVDDADVDDADVEVLAASRPAGPGEQSAPRQGGPGRQGAPRQGARGRAPGADSDAPQRAATPDPVVIDGEAYWTGRRTDGRR